MDEPLSKADKLNVLRQDQSLLSERNRSFNTLHGRAIADVNELGGRYTKVEERHVVGSGPVAYPRMQSGPWAEGIDQVCGIEPAIDATDCRSTGVDEAVGGPSERVPSSGRLAPEEGHVGVALTLGDGPIEGATPSTLSPAAVEERRAALADRLVQINAGLSAPKEEANPPLEAARGPVRIMSRAGPLTIRRRV